MISWGQILELRNDVGQDGFDEVISIFLEEVETTLNHLPQSSQLEEDLHALRGSAMTLGFRACAALCAQGEKLAGEGCADRVDLNAIQTTYLESKALFLAELPARLAA
ncbi:Hpt domain-containing protein [Pseudooceanicola spongiae]|jgi:histidine phosphotransfer protein HptB|uniref:Hpt domain-containing protein n=1 Tax=Pseudooceanicola spongiae TaxID=2613965 RepID=A0A7L9WQR5_9RHOB|nr:Hpt domain-containing protein [Pseudooceanicola spongiae]QOL82057.1 Hpt domain-containing protein [Pseudooceanicola spongiae]|tara:strand:- start:169 stop:492 length:324 start_codon:yes stop_codon:yes gene_type:complete